MLLFQKRFHEGLVRGDVTLTFRRWPKARVKVGGRYRCHPIGVLEVDHVSRTTVGELSDADAVRSGFASRSELLDYLASGPGGVVDDATEIFRIGLHHGGDGDRVPAALDATVDEAARAAIDDALGKLDAKGAWTRATLAMIAERPRVAASQLAAAFGRETEPFKEDVRKLKRLGLTQAFEVGYELSPRGQAYLRTRSEADEATRPARGSRKGRGAR